MKTIFKVASSLIGMTSSRIINLNRTKLYLLLFGIAVVLKSFYFYVGMLSDVPPSENQIWHLNGDELDYVTLSENLHNLGVYGFKTGDNTWNYTFRMPGLAVVYNPLRLMLSKEDTVTTIIVLQVLLSALCCLVVFIISCHFFKRLTSCLITYILFTCSLYTSQFNGQFICESLAAFAFLFGILLQLRKKYVISGLFYTWLIFLRPFMIVGVALLIFYEIFKNRELYKALLLTLPIFLLISIWTYRNYRLTNKFIPLQSSLEWYNSSQSLTSRIVFIKALGYPWVWWNSNEHGWFLNENTGGNYNPVYVLPIGVKRPSDDIFDKSIFSSDFTLDSLKKARELSIKVIDTTLSTADRTRCDKESARLLNWFIRKYREKHPFKYHIINPLNISIRFLNQPRSQSVMSLKYPFNLLLRGIDAFFNYFIIISGLLGVVLLFLKTRINQFNVLHFISLISLFIILLFPFYLRIDEAKFLFFGYLSLVFTSAFAIDYIVQKYPRSKDVLLFSLISILLITVIHVFFMYR